jgi:outer membrane lipoprotein SlyB
MKKFLAIMMCLLVLTVAAVPAGAQTRYDRRQRAEAARQSRSYDRYNQRYDDRSVWQKHRDKITTAGGAVGGAIIGGLIGGKKGAIVGAIAGGGGAAVYTYKVRDKYRNY